MKRPEKEIGISAVRGGTIVGDHDVIFAGEDEVITFSHSAYSKAVFGKGAVQAAKFLAGKGPGYYNMGDVIGDLNARRGRVEGMNAHAGTQSIDAMVPLSEMFGYATDLRSKTQGRGNYTMQFAHYEEVPKSIANKVMGIK